MGLEREMATLDLLTGSVSSTTGDGLSTAENTLDNIPPHRSHDASNNLKRSDPFQFGSRYLLPEDNP